MTRSVAEIAQLFDASADVGANLADEIYPGYPGLVIADGQARPMTWGFPLAMIGKRGLPLKPKPVNNAREDKLATAFWRDSFVHRRCLIPVTGWAEADGERGRMTRNWYWLPGGEPFAIAGIWRPTAEWGDAYTMVMVDSGPQIAEVNDRMPVVLHRDHWQQWLSGTATAACALCRTWDDDLVVEQTTDPWRASPTVARLI